MHHVFLLLLLLFVFVGQLKVIIAFVSAASGLSGTCRRLWPLMAAAFPAPCNPSCSWQEMRSVRMIMTVVAAEALVGPAPYVKTRPKPLEVTRTSLGAPAVATISTTSTQDDGTVVVKPQRETLESLRSRVLARYDEYDGAFEDVPGNYTKLAADVADINMRFDLADRGLLFFGVLGPLIAFKFCYQV